MNFQDKTKDELIKELQKLQKEYDLLKTSYEKDISGRKLAEKALGESEERFRLLAEATFEAIAIHDEAVLLNANDQYFKMFGYKPGEILGKQVMTMTVAPEAREFMTKQIATGGMGPYESTGFRKDGTKFPMEICVRQIEYKGRSVRVGAIVDITERKRAEKALRESEERFRHISSTISDISYSCVINQKGSYSINWMTGATERITGYSIDEIKAKHCWGKLVVDEDLDSFKQHVTGLTPDSSGTCELRLRHKNGGIIWITSFAECIKDQEQPDRLILYGGLVDITERKQTEELLKESMERLKEAQKLAHIGVWDWKPDTDIVTWTDELYHIAGLDPMLPAPTYKEHSGLYTPESWELLKTGVEKALKTGESYQLELKLIRPKGDTRLVNAFGGPKFDSKGQINGLFGTVQDITERKQVEKELYFQGEIMKNISEGINLIRVDDEIIVFTNQKFDEMFGYNSEELIGKHVFTLNASAGKSPEETKQDIVDTVNRTGEWHGEILNIKKSGDHFWCYVDVSVFDHPDYGKVFLSVHSDITERKRNQAELIESEARFRSLFENSLLGISLARPDGSLFQVNLAYARMYGYESPEVLFTEVHETRILFAKPEERKEVLRELQMNGFMEQREFEVIRRDGSHFFGLVSASEIRDSEGKLLFNMATHIDLTDRKKTEENLRKSEEKFFKLFHSSPDAIFVTDLKTERIIEVNKNFEKLSGFSHDELIGKTISELNIYKQTERPTFVSMLQKLGSINNIEFKLKNKSGREMIVSSSAELFQINEESHIITILHDITERKQAEKALSLEKENFRYSLDDSPLGVRIARKEGKTIYANQTILNFYGYNNLGELQNTPLKKRYTPESYAEAQKRKHEREHGESSASNYKISIVRKNGEIRHLQVFRKEVLWDGILQYQIIYEDITGHKQAEEEIRKSKKLLEDLYKHQIDIRENERASISREIHDELGQSMTALKLDLKMMHKYVGTNPEAIMKLDSMIELVSDTIKDVQRISSDLRPGILDDLGLISAIEWYCDEFEKRTGIKCSLKIDDSDYNDSQINLTLFRALQETLTNVIRHARASSVNVKLHKSDKGATLTIRDNGIGIAEEKIESQKSLGLISMRERVKQFNGKIDISSKRGEGTKLTIFIPNQKNGLL